MLTIELYLTRKEVLALREEGLTDSEIGRKLELVPDLIPGIINKELFIDFRLSSTSTWKGDDFGALFKRLAPPDRDRELRELVYNRVKKMGYHFSTARLDQIYDAALRDAE